jgi:hypothetical protein
MPFLIVYLLLTCLYFLLTFFWGLLLWHFDATSVRTILAAFNNCFSLSLSACLTRTRIRLTIVFTCYIVGQNSICDLRDLLSAVPRESHFVVRLGHLQLSHGHRVARLEHRDDHHLPDQIGVHLRHDAARRDGPAHLSSLAAAENHRACCHVRVSRLCRVTNLASKSLI